MSDLVQRLRTVTGFIRFETGDRVLAAGSISEEAADRIEALEKEVASWRSQCLQSDFDQAEMERMYRAERALTDRFYAEATKGKISHALGLAYRKARGM